VNRIHDLAEVEPGASIGPGSSVWQLAHVRENASIGENCVIGRGVYVGTGVQIGSNVKIQNYALIYEPAVIEDGVFIGPAVVLTNDLNPRAVTPAGKVKGTADWKIARVYISTGASIGANSVCIAPVTIGQWALVGAGSVVTRDVPDYALVMGNPARQVAWVGKAGDKLVPSGPNTFRCPRTGDIYTEKAGKLEPQS
jgi:UDP-2-acetamido-3-amino-2,3-dideoxy-glucuronate N-acetyltransferase